MNDSPGWASPGHSSSDPDSSGSSGKGQGAPGDDKERTTSEATPHDQPRPTSDEAPRSWAASQPPAAPRQGGAQGWGAAPPPPNAGPGAGGWNNKGWSAGRNQPPQVAKPGVIPLRPLGIGEILDGSVSTMRAHWRTALGISLAVAVITELVSAVTMGIWFSDDNELAALADNDSPSLEDIDRALTGALGGLSVAVLVSMLGSVIATAMLTVVVSRAVLGHQITIGEAWRDSRPQLLRLLGLLVLIPLLVSAVMFLCVLPGILAALAGSAGAGLALLFLGIIGGIVAGAWIWVRFCLSAPALMLEKQGVLSSMRRSAKLVRGSWWRILGIQLLAFLLVIVISSVVQLPTTVIATLVGDGGGLTSVSAATSWPSLIINGIGSVLASTIALPLSAGITALLYLDQRIRREALDLELARAAGVPGYGREEPGSSAQSAPGS
ncbi:glycerophosphoryl diester phosphodiesterase membrane domain-containing protein [Streptomyces sp. NBC_01775]|uniref:DUF7544 domain-containing protein n=1 Tax=Streptomyces sp. NBC_01775 TaxID=2975939 RepID=UPI002DDAB77E|nr:hypothetical protein [Streptomyces sp. NBC_01775]WSB78798.1 glycerophosphoryl diester phosphodiesterase membrane domain-containing protein [Streptomyces sp. NBC_01775]